MLLSQVVVAESSRAWIERGNGEARFLSGIAAGRTTLRESSLSIGLLPADRTCEQQRLNKSSRRSVWFNDPDPSAGRPSPDRADERARWGGSASVGVGMTTLEVTLELPRDRLAAGLGQIAAVAGALQRLDVLGDLPVLAGQLVDGLLP